MRDRIRRVPWLEIALAAAGAALLWQIAPTTRLAGLWHAFVALSYAGDWAPWEWFVVCGACLAVLIMVRFRWGYRLSWSGNLEPAQGAPGRGGADPVDPSLPGGAGWRAAPKWVVLAAAGYQAACFCYYGSDLALQAADFTAWPWWGWSVFFGVLLSLLLAVRFGPELSRGVGTHRRRLAARRAAEHREQERIERVRRDREMRERFEKRLPYH